MHHAGRVTTLAPAAVRYNDWRRLHVQPPDSFRPTLPVSVIVSYFEAPEALARTLAALESQDWPRDLFEVVIVDDGSRVPLEQPRTTLPNVTVVHQEDRGFRLARARNAGVRAAAHDILLFLDGDMLPEAGWLAAHARWHHAVSDTLTLGFRAHVAVDGITPTAIRAPSGTLKELLAGRPADADFRDYFVAWTRELTSPRDDLFIAMVGGNFGIRRDLYEGSGGCDESFSRWGGEDIEFAYRAFTRGGVLVPVREAFAWHQGRLAEDAERKDESRLRQRPKLANLVAHAAYRDGNPGRIFAVPQFVVRIRAGDLPADRVAETATKVLADRMHDLVVRVELPAGDDRLPFLRDAFDPDPRVRLGARAGGGILEEFPATPFHVELPACVAFSSGVVHRLRRELGAAASAAAVLPDGSTASITRAWALHRARRTGRSVGDFGDVIGIPAWRLRVFVARTSRDGRFRRQRATARVRRMLSILRSVRTPRHAALFLAWLWSALNRRAARFVRSRTRGSRETA